MGMDAIRIGGVRHDVWHGFQLYDSRGLQIVTDRPLA
jgi:hypothetical protein